MALIDAQVKASFLASQRSAHDEYMTKTITWKKRAGKKRSEWGEDTPETYEDRELKVLENYNYMRTWPITQHTESGSLDKQSIQLFISKFHLEDAGWLNSQGNMDYDPGYDRFIIDGVPYIAAGDTLSSQFFEDDLLFLINVRASISDNYLVNTVGSNPNPTPPAGWKETYQLSFLALEGTTQYQHNDLLGAELLSLHLEGVELFGGNGSGEMQGLDPVTGIISWNDPVPPGITFRGKILYKK